MLSTLDTEFIFKLLLNTLSVSLLVFGCYMRGFSKHTGGNREYAASYILFATGVFTVTYLLHSVDISMGFAFGLFAVFSMLRYRTESISVKEMTYLFLVISTSLLSAVSSASLLELALLHSIFLMCALVCEFILVKNNLLEQMVQYEKIENIKPKNHKILINDLKERLGLDVQSVSILNIDLVKDSAHLLIKYRPQLSVEGIRQINRNALTVTSELD